MGLFGFIYLLGAQPLSCFLSLAFGSLQSFRDETDLAGSFFVPPPFSLGVWDGWEECRFMTALGEVSGGCPKSFSWYDNAHFFPSANTVPQTALVPLGALPPPSPPFLSAGSSWQAQAHLNSSMVSTFPRTTTLYYYGYPPLGSGAPLASPEELG